MVEKRVARTLAQWEAILAEREKRLGPNNLLVLKLKAQIIAERLRRAELRNKENVSVKPSRLGTNPTKDYIIKRLREVPRR